MNQAEFIQHCYIAGFCRGANSEIKDNTEWNNAVEACAKKFDEILLEAIQNDKSPSFKVGFLSELKK